ncbi:retrovirus-related pol polyprotein from transposon tnt 1-94 [Plasmopara halstedii]|uniref:Retrovirus-related pol polyprotein from transposon tnt 1-94 n=1 Tax=Plasmopara halstedii TaxID=4781 RepID=A0A0P1B4D5_PLAHL|nr:retrovirus-related pol polyprotein from transposon tnt 1-94 [Plasmopara halstedii]CEG49225.1 retrovirus-related pol polyprotein from transposon tnt 1-94 [Plasmopara halstedii]|eukprot:XP_024585594.1 retrovirus-related pol polyprotein from transposon tnt 1-94 [Plasmopara halstedii]
MKELGTATFILGMEIDYDRNGSTLMFRQTRYVDDVGKQTVDSFPSRSLTKASHVLELVHTDVMSPMKTVSKGGARYVLTFVDDFSRFVVAYFIKHKSEVAAKLSEFKTLYKNQWERRLKCLRSDKETDNDEEQKVKESDTPPIAKRARIDEEGLIAEAVLAYAANVGEVDDAPTTYQQAMNSEDAMEWVKAMNAELKAHLENGSWLLVPKKKDVRPIGCRWVFAKKRNELGQVTPSTGSVQQCYS